MYMDMMRFDQFQSLLRLRDNPCVSCYLPTFVSGNEIRQNTIRFKNIISVAERKLKEYGFDEKETENIVKPAHMILKESRYWKHLGQGLAIFITKNTFEMYRLPYHVQEKVILSDRFNIIPLIHLFTDDGNFYILSLSLNGVHFYSSDHYFMREIKLEKVPLSLNDALKYDEQEKQRQLHSHIGQGGKGVAIYHGHGVGTDVKDSNLLRYCQQINEGLLEYLKDKDTPLVLAAVDYIHPVFHEAVHYQHIANDGIIGNPDYMSAQDLRESAWKIVEPIFAQTREKLLARFEDLHKSHLASTDPHSVITASAEGRVDTLFIAENTELCGSFDDSSNNIMIKINNGGSDNLLNIAVNYTFMNSGAVYSESRERIPGKADLAAIFRY